MSKTSLKQRIYPEFARIAQALGSERRLELVDLLAQGPRHVEALAQESGMSVANVSQHLQILRAAHLVEADRAGTRVVYCLSGVDVLRLWLSLRGVAERRLPEVAAIHSAFAVSGAEGTPMARPEVLARLSAGTALLIDVRPALEFEAGHIPGAISVPPEELTVQLEGFPRDRPIVAYCRGEYCLMADEAVALLRERGFEAYRLEGGWPEWWADGGDD